MKIIISPAKKMNTDVDTLAPAGTPVFLKDTEHIMEWMRQLSYEEAKKLWGCNDKIARQNFERFRDMDLHRHLTPAILSYEGIQYQYMALMVFEEDMFTYVQAHLRILSGFYGVLKPMDGVTPYRLEMQAKAKIGGTKDLYEFWGRRLYEEIVLSDGKEAASGRHTIINLASKEYAKCVETYLEPNDLFLTCVFGEMEKGKVVQKGTYAKMARGEMVRFMAEHQVSEPEKLKEFDHLGYVFCEAHSTEDTYVFVKQTGTAG